MLAGPPTAVDKCPDTHSTCAPSPGHKPIRAKRCSDPAAGRSNPLGDIHLGHNGTVFCAPHVGLEHDTRGEPVGILRDPAADHQQERRVFVLRKVLIHRLCDSRVAHLIEELSARLPLFRGRVYCTREELDIYSSGNPILLHSIAEICQVKSTTGTERGRHATIHNQMRGGDGERVGLRKCPQSVMLEDTMPQRVHSRAVSIVLQPDRER
mmetsp:Transcript_27101/g.59994  ORF Transcript_27101/g.59994 Transcript_27101/m.59994 type:complete len:210 (-) Transcript_27101:87-716(-)